MPRVRSTNVVASPPLAAETVVAALTGIALPPGDVIDLSGNIDITIGTSGVSVVLKVRRGVDTTGVPVFTSSPYTVVAANHYNLDANCFDQQVPEQANVGYVLTVTVGSGAATSTVNNVFFGGVF